MKRFFIYSCLVFLFSCDRGPYAEHNIKLEKVADDCSQRQSYFRVKSDFAQLLYDFEKCLPVDFNKDNVTSERRGDTVVVNFGPTASTASKAVYHVILGIDSYPAYHNITIDGETHGIVPTN
jgi:hypothetical protein